MTTSEPIAATEQDAVISDELIDVLATFEGGDNYVLSVYLNLDTERQVARSHRLILDDLIAGLTANAELDEAMTAALSAEAQRVREYLETEAPGGNGLALFACAPLDLWEVYELPVPVEDAVFFEPTLHLLPLRDVLDEYERYAVALVDQQRARLYTIHLGQIEEQQEISNNVLSRQSNGGWSQARYQRRHELQVGKHLEQVVGVLTDMLERRPYDRLVLAGQHNATRELQAMLPQHLADRLATTLPADLSLKDPQVVEKTLEAAREDERADEAEIVEDVFHRDASGGLGVTGLKPTLEAVWKAQVHQLVVAEGARAPGSICPACGWLEAVAPAERAVGDGETAGGALQASAVPAPLPPCPLCQTPLDPIPDVIERAAQDAVTKGGTVEIVHGEAAANLIESGEGVGAMLRFASS